MLNNKKVAKYRDTEVYVKMSNYIICKDKHISCAHILKKSREENGILRSILDEMMKNNLLTAKQMYTDFKNNEIINEIEETTIDNEQNDNSGNSY